MRLHKILFLCSLVTFGFVVDVVHENSAFAKQSAVTGKHDIGLAELPPEALETIALIKQGGPFPYKRDGVVFSNREKKLPKRPRGYYREFTVSTPSKKGRGERRIVVGQQGEYYYTANHYKSFKRIRDVN